MKVFMSYFSDEAPDAEDLADHLKALFARDGLELFLYSSWDSIAPGEEWQSKVMEGLGKADALLVLMSHDALTRPWINFEIGVAWCKNIRVLLLCHKGMTPGALPSPYASLQAIDLNGLTHQQTLERVADAVARSLNLTISSEEKAAYAEPPPEAAPFASTLRTWTLRPASHIGETARSRFLVGAVANVRPDRAKAAGLEPGETLYVRLFLGTRPEGRYINAMVGGDAADFFERVERGASVIDAEIRLAASFYDDVAESNIPLLVIDDSQPVSGVIT
jgi:hypothetical protein